VAIGMELVTNPPILFLDEPTTGLDTYTAYSVMSTLKALAASGNNSESTLISDLFSKNSRTQILKSGLAADF